MTLTRKIIFIFSIIFLFNSCQNKQESDLNLQHLNHIAGKINHDLKTISNDLVQLADHVQHKIPFEKNVQFKLGGRYHCQKDKILFSLYNENYSAVYLPPGKNFNEKIKKLVINSEKLDPLFIDIIISNPLLTQVYFLDSNSFLRIYPHIDVLNYLKNSKDLTNLIAYQTVKGKPFSYNNAYWVNKPFADPYGRGWIISCVEPVYYRDDFIGIISGDVTLKSLKSKYFSSNTEMVLLLDNSGELICCTKEGAKLLNIPPFREYNYYKPVIEDVFIYNQPSLLNHKNKNFKNALKKLIAGSTKAEFNMNNNKYTIYKSNIEETNWVLLKIIN